MSNITLLHGDCLEQMRGLGDNTVDSIVTDPPYGISFMAKKWDYDVPSAEVWKEALRVLKPGGHALIACGTRTQHRMVVNIEDAGFEIRDVVSWIYGSGFPKSLNISKAIDKAAGAEREVVGVKKGTGKQNPKWNGTEAGRKENSLKPEYDDTAPATEEAKQWDGWGTALKPACEFFTLCRKPLSESTVAKNVLKWGTGGINIDGCRVEYLGDADKASATPQGKVTSKNTSSGNGAATPDIGRNEDRVEFDRPEQKGRFPANLIHDGSQEVLDLFPETKSHGGGQSSFGGMFGNGGKAAKTFASQGSAARFFYCAKASKKDRDEGLEGFEEKKSRKWRDDKGMKLTGSGNPGNEMSRNTHPTVKPTALMAYLCRLITPTGGVVLDPYMGSGSTGKAAVKEGFEFIGCELDADYYEIAKARIENE